MLTAGTHYLLLTTYYVLCARASRSGTFRRCIPARAVGGIAPR